MAIVFEKPKSLANVPLHYCPGCPHGIIHRLVAEAIDELGIEGKTIGVAPVGCAVMAYDYIACDMIEAAHGRAPATATGIKRCRPDNIVNSLYLKPDELEVKPFERYERYKIVEENEPMWEEYMMVDAEYCVVAFGIASRVAKNAVVAARAEGIKVGLIRPITLWPIPKKA